MLRGDRKISEQRFAKLAKGAGLKILSRRSSRVRIPYPAFVRLRGHFCFQPVSRRAECHNQNNIFKPNILRIYWMRDIAGRPVAGRPRGTLWLFQSLP